MSADAIDISSTNRVFWNSRAATYDQTNDPLAKAVIQAIAENADWIGIPHSGKVLDFACGTGLVSAAIANHGPSLSFRGIDISDQMVAQYNDRFKTMNGPNGLAVEVDLMSSSAFQPESPIAGPEWLDFDVAAVANSLHHIDKAEIAIARLVERLKVGGILCVIDWIDDGKEHHKHHHPTHNHRGGRSGEGANDQQNTLNKHGVVHRHGFSKEQISSLMKAAGLEAVDFRAREGTLQFGPFERKIFIARGTKPSPPKLGLSKATPWTLLH